MCNKTTSYGLLARSCVLCLLALLTANTACEAAPSQHVWVRAGRLIDGTGAPAQSGMRIEIDDGLITAVKPDDETVIPAGTAIVDARKLTVLPGLVDAHTHLFTSAACKPGRDSGLRQAVRNLQAYINAGVTTVADLAAPAPAAVGLRHYVGTARGRGPRVLVAGPMLTAPNGYLVGIDDPYGLRKRGMVRELSNVDDARAAVRELYARGVDVVKLGLQAHNYDTRPLPLLDKDVICAVVDEAHKQKLRVFAHAIEAEATQRAVDCGVDVVAHGASEPLSDPLIAQMARTKTIVLPTFRVFEALWEDPETQRSRLARAETAVSVADASRLDLQHYADANDPHAPTLPDSFGVLVPRDNLRTAARERLANIGRMRTAGVPFGFGTDSAFCYHWAGEPWEELQRLVDAGIAPLEALRIGSHGGAAALGLQDAIGVLQPGYRADLVAVQGEPDKLLPALREVRHVLIEGVPQRAGDTTWYAPILMFFNVAVTRIRGA